MDAQFVWPSGTLSPGVIPDPFDAAALELGFLLGSYTAVDMFLANGEGAVGIIESVQVVPEPKTTALVAIALALLWAWRSLVRYIKT
jgi:hypothetical protein